MQLSSATTSAEETKAATPKAVNDASAKKSANLSDLTDKSAARGNLALGSAATKNVGVEGGQLMAVGTFGLEAGARALIMPIAIPRRFIVLMRHQKTSHLLAVTLLPGSLACLVMLHRPPVMSVRQV